MRFKLLSTLFRRGIIRPRRATTVIDLNRSLERAVRTQVSMGSVDKPARPSARSLARASYFYSALLGFNRIGEGEILNVVSFLPLLSPSIVYSAEYLKPVAQRRLALRDETGTRSSRDERVYLKWRAALLRVFPSSSSSCHRKRTRVLCN